MEQLGIKQFFKNNKRRREFPKGTIIILQNDAHQEAYLITKGMVRVSDYDYKGNQRTVTIISTGHVFPFSWLLSTLPKEGAVYYYQAITDVTCYIAPFDKVREFVKNNPAVAWGLLDALAKSYYNAAARLQNLQKSDVAEKVEFILYYIALMLCRLDGNKLATIRIPLTHQEIADLAGLTRETVTRELTKKKYKEIIWKDRGSTYININKLNTVNMPRIFPLRVK